MNRLTVIGLAVGILLTALAASLIYTQSQKNRLPIMDSIGGSFSLPSTEGRELQLSDFKGKVVMLNFGFTSCPDVCPTVLARMRLVLETIGEQASNVQPLFITIDPERDSLDKLKSYLSFFHPSIIGLRGNKEQLKKVAELYKAVYQKQTMSSSLDYGFLHNDHIYLIDQQGQTRAMISSSTKPVEIANKIVTLL